MKFNDREADRIRKNALWRNMSIIQNAMGKTNTSWTPAQPRRDVYSDKKKSRAKGGINLISRHTESKRERSSISSFPVIETNTS